MTPEEISERVIEAAALERRMPKAGTAPRGDGGGYALPWVHEYADIMGRWKTRDDQLAPGDDPLQTWRDEFWSGRQPLSAAEMSRWEGVLDWIRLRLDDPRERRALMHWAIAKAGGKPFARWCRREKISVETGRRRKNRALQRISAWMNRHDARRVAQHSGSDGFAALMDGAEITYFADMIAADEGAEKAPKRYTWRDDDGLKPLLEHGHRSSRRKAVGFR